MGELNYSLMWDAYNTNICTGLSLLQQRGEFVDMTLAADGHLVKVHKMVMSLVSPYIKDLIASADCTHPVIFLNQISYETLSSILEYVYTGQVVVPKDELTKFMEASKALHIKGFEELEGMPINDSNIENEFTENTLIYEDQENIQESIITEHDYMDNSDIDVHKEDIHVELDDDIPTEEIISHSPQQGNVHCKKPMIQYSLSNHGNLQLILNRYLFNLRYSSRRSGQRRWQCVDGVCKETKCPARVTTYRDIVIRRSKAHNHPHHDKKILKKIEVGTIFTALNEAETQMRLIRKLKADETE